MDPWYHASVLCLSPPCRASFISPTMCGYSLSVATLKDSWRSRHEFLSFERVKTAIALRKAMQRKLRVQITLPSRSCPWTGTAKGIGPPRTMAWAASEQPRIELSIRSCSFLSPNAGDNIYTLSQSLRDTQTLHVPISSRRTAYPRRGYTSSFIFWQMKLPGDFH